LWWRRRDEARLGENASGRNISLVVAEEKEEEGLDLR
jgi:hypothetical protein